MSLKPLVEAAFGRTPHRLPVWFLRQAGRYLPEYQKVRSQLSFVELCRNPQMAAEVTLQPLRRFDLDAAIIFSDILIPPTAMGQELTFGKGHGPLMSPPVRSGQDVAKLRRPVVADELGYVAEAIELTKKSLQPSQTMIGFAGAPFTVASYMIEGQGSKVYTEVKQMIYNDPQAFHGLLDLLAEVSYDYLAMQVRAGADALMLFDTWVGHLTVGHFVEFVKPVMIKLTSRLRQAFPHVPLTYYPGQGTELYYELDGIAVDVIAVDWRVRLARAIGVLQSLSLNVSVQGNLDPQAFLANDSELEKQIWDIVEQGKAARGHIFNVGHGLLPHLRPEKIGFVIEQIRRSDGK